MSQPSCLERKAQRGMDMRPVPARSERIVLSVLSLQHTNGGDAPANRIHIYGTLHKQNQCESLVDQVICIPPAPGLAFTPIISSTIRSTDEGVEGAGELWSFAQPDFTNILKKYNQQFCRQHVFWITLAKQPSADSGLAMPQPPAPKQTR